MTIFRATKTKHYVSYKTENLTRNQARGKKQVFFYRKEAYALLENYFPEFWS